MDLEDIRSNYAKFDDSKIKWLATNNPALLEPEAIDLLKEEIRKRGLDHSLETSIDLLTRKLSEKELNEYCDIIRNQPCPYCRSSSSKLNATIIGTVISYFLMMHNDKFTRIGCKNCLDNEHRKAIMKSAVLGWWYIPMGPIRTVQSFFFNSDRKHDYHKHSISPTLKDFVIENLGDIETSKYDSKQIAQLIKHINQI